MQSIWRNKDIILVSVLLSLVFITATGSLFTTPYGLQAANTISGLALVITLLTASILALLLWRSDHDRSHANRVWLVLGVGLFLNFVAEAIWLYFSITLEGEVPYPSVADLAWVISTLCLILGLLNQLRAMQVIITRRQLLAAGIVSTVILVLIFAFVIYPILVEPSTEGWLVFFLNLFYPLADLVLIMVGVLLISVLFGGENSNTWITFTLGAFLLAAADIGYTYFGWNGLYLPDTAPSLASRLIDTGYMASALLFTLGMAIAIKLEATRQEALILPKTSLGAAQPLPTEKVLAAFSRVTIFTDAEHRVVFISPTVQTLFYLAGDTAPLTGRPLAELLGLNGQMVADLMATISRTPSLSRPLDIHVLGVNVPVTFLAARRQREVPKGTARLILPLPNQPAPGYAGADIFLSLRRSEAAALAQFESASVTELYLSEHLAHLPVSADLPFSQKAILAFFVASLSDLYILVVRLSGAGMGASWCERVNDTARKSTSPGVGGVISIQEGQVNFTDPPSKEAMFSLWTFALRYTAALTSQRVVDTFLAQQKARTPADILAAAVEAGLAKAD